MDTRVVVGLLAGALLLGLCFIDVDEDAGGPLPAEYAQGPEALNWLKKSRNESALASNRFLETHNAVRFVEQLYGAGAQKVIVPTVSIENDGVEIYADALVVTLPADAAKRDRVWQMCKKELEREGVKAPKSSTDEQVFLWWD